MSETVLTLAPSAPILTDAQVAAIPATATTPAPRAVPYKRWVFAGVLAFALIGGGALNKAYHKPHPVPALVPIPIAQSIKPPAPLPEPAVCTPAAPLLAPWPTIVPTPFDGDRYVPQPKAKPKPKPVKKHL